jgi:hypothetical protein
VGSEVTEENGDVDGVPEVGVTDVESMDGLGRNGVGIENFTVSGLGGQCELEGMKTFATGGKGSNSVLQMGHQRGVEQTGSVR